MRPYQAGRRGCGVSANTCRASCPRSVRVRRNWWRQTTAATSSGKITGYGESVIWAHAAIPYARAHDQAVNVSSHPKRRRSQMSGAGSGTGRSGSPTPVSRPATTRAHHSSRTTTAYARAQPPGTRSPRAAPPGSDSAAPAASVPNGSQAMSPAESPESPSARSAAASHSITASVARNAAQTASSSSAVRSSSRRARRACARTGSTSAPSGGATGRSAWSTSSSTTRLRNAALTWAPAQSSRVASVCA
ncbi:hypothetical protein [Streptomyces alboflavus]|nr:hypothetical protein [Streptomyces alboflavus]